MPVYAQCVEVSSGLLAKGREFLDDWGGRIDLIVAIFSVLGEATCRAVPRQMDGVGDGRVGGRGYITPFCGRSGYWKLAQY